MENNEKGLRAEVATNYLRLTDAAIRAATLPPGKSIMIEDEDDKKSAVFAD